MRILFLKLKRRSKPSRAYKKTLWSELDTAFSENYTKPIVFQWGRFVAIPTLAMVMLVTTGTGVYAYSSPEVDGDDSLFVVKTGIEAVEMQFYRSDDARYDFHERMLDRRMEEAQRRYDAGQLTEGHMELIEMRISTMSELSEYAPELPRGMMLSDDLCSELDALLNDKPTEGGCDQDRLPRRFEEVRNVLHGDSVQYDEASESVNLEAVDELELMLPDTFQMESFR